MKLRNNGDSELLDRFIICICAFLMLSFYTQNDTFANEVSDETKSFVISGQKVQLVNIAFDDYILELDDYHSDVLKKIKVYIFQYTQRENIANIKIIYDNDELKKLIGSTMKGGGAEYWIDMKTRVIIKRVRYK